jgi:hypothetical protein
MSYYDWKLLNGYNKDDLDLLYKELGEDFWVMEQENDEKEYRKFISENFSELQINQLSIYEKAFLKYYESLDTIDGVELDKYLDIKIKEVIDLLKIKPQQSLIDFKSLDLKIREAYYNGEDINKFIDKVIQESGNKFLENEQNSRIDKDLVFDSIDVNFVKLKPFLKNPFYETLKKLDLFIHGTPTNIF